MVAASKPAEQLTPFGHALAGALGAVFSNAVVYPLDTAKTRIQAAPSEKRKGKNSKPLSVFPLLVRILKEEGIGGYYKGFTASMLNTFSGQYAYFFFYSFLRSSYLRRLARNAPPNTKIPSISTAIELLIGAVAGALAQIFTIPVSIIATRQQVGSTKNRSRPQTYAEKLAGVSPTATAEEDDDSFFAVGREIIREDGVTGLWTGLKPGLVLTVNPAITYGVFERVKSFALVGADANAKLNPLQSFAVGACSKTLATIVTYPYIMAKVRLQARSTDHEAIPAHQDLEKGDAHVPKPRKIAVVPRYRGAIDVLTKVWKQQGFIGWYQGMGAQITKAVLSQALLFMLKDQFERYALLIMILFRRLRSKKV